MERGEIGLAHVARRTLVSTLVVLGVVVGALVLWKARVVVTLLFLAMVIAAAVRSGVDTLARYRVPRAAGIALHYVAIAGLVALLLWLAVPRALSQAQSAVGDVPAKRAQIAHQARASHGLKRQVLLAVEAHLRNLPSIRELVDPAIEITRKAVEAIVGIFFVFAAAAYWIYERDRFERFVLEIVPSRHQRVVSNTWRLVDLKLGAFVRGQTLLVLLVGGVLSFVFWLIGEPFWLLIGMFAGLVELVPVVGPLAAGVLAVGVGLTASWHVALAAGIAVLVIRLLEDYVVVPRVLGNAVGLSPLVVLVSVASVGVVLGGMAVLLAVPVAAVVATLVDVFVLGRNPSDQEVPTLLFPAKDLQADAAARDRAGPGR